MTKSSKSRSSTKNPVFDLNAPDRHAVNGISAEPITDNSRDSEGSILAESASRAEINEFIPPIIEQNFDRDFYLNTYEDVRSSGSDPILHYLYTGWVEGRNPSPDFDTDFYLRQYPDIKIAGINPYYHYLMHGKSEGRSCLSPEALAAKSRAIIARVREQLLSTPSAYADLAQLLDGIQPAKQASRVARAYIEMAAAVDHSRDAVVVGWAVHEPNVPIWLETDSGKICPLTQTFRRTRDDVMKTVSSSFSNPFVRPGFLAHLSEVTVAARVCVKSLDDDGIHMLAEVRVDKMATSLMDIARWLAGIDTPLSELNKRIPLIDEPVLRPLIEARALTWKHLPLSEYVMGSLKPHPIASIVIPLYGRFDFIEHQLIEFAKDPWIKAHAEVIYVIDDPALVDPLRAEVSHLFGLYQFPFRCVFGEVNRGFSGANNLGVTVSGGEFLVFLNSDAFPRKPGWCEALIEVLRTCPSVGAVGPRLLFADGSIQHCGMEYLRREDLGIWTNHHPNMGLDPGLDPHQALTSVPGITGACLAMRRTDFDEIGGWDTDYLIGDFEDSDLCFKLRSLGYQVAYLPTVELTHLERQSFKLLGQGDFRTRIVIYNAMRHQTKWKSLLETAPTEIGNL